MTKSTYEIKERNFFNGTKFEVIFYGIDNIGYYNTLSLAKKAIVSHQIDDGVKG